MNELDAITVCRRFNTLKIPYQSCVISLVWLDEPAFVFHRWREARCLGLDQYVVELSRELGHITVVLDWDNRTFVYRHGRMMEERKGTRWRFNKT